MSILFYVSDYREYIQDRIQHASKIKGYRTRLALAAGCKPSYLSQVLNSHVQLTPDQAANLAEFWNLDADESEFFITLVCYERAGTPSLKKTLLRRLNELRKKNTSVGSVIKDTEEIPDSFVQKYYSTWIYAAIRMSLGTKNSSTEAISKTLRLSEKTVLRYLQEMREVGLVSHVNDRWKKNNKSIHLPQSHPLANCYHGVWRREAIARAFENTDDEQITYTALHTISASDFKKIRLQILNAIEQSRQTVSESGSEELICLTVDLFRF